VELGREAEYYFPSGFYFLVSLSKRMVERRREGSKTLKENDTAPAKTSRSCTKLFGYARFGRLFVPWD